jgi:ABC-2 type transport system ATP-binding protein
MPHPVIEVRNLTKVYEKRSQLPVHAVKGISFHVEKGQIFGLLGPNGAGKTTTIKILTTLLQPSSGSAQIQEFDVVSHGTDVRKVICAVVQENAIELYLSVRNNFRTFGKFHGLSLKEIDLHVDRVSELFNLREHLNERGMDLSGGMKRRVQVAKMFLIDKPIVFLDEATTGMDAFNKRTTVEAIHEESHKGRTILLTTHILDEAEALCDAVAIVHHGLIIAQGSVEQVKSMSLHLYYLTLSCDPLTPVTEEWLKRWNPVTLSHSRSIWTIGLKSEMEALEILNAIKQICRIEHFEVTSANLEDAFIELIDKKGATSN